MTEDGQAVAPEIFVATSREITSDTRRFLNIRFRTHQIAFMLRTYRSMLIGRALIIDESGISHDDSNDRSGDVGRWPKFKTDSFPVPACFPRFDSGGWIASMVSANRIGWHWGLVSPVDSATSK